jgi:hypothetical protein
MASITITFTDNGDGTATITTAGATGSAAQSYKSDALTALMNVAKGWVDQSIPLLVFN